MATTEAVKPKPSPFDLSVNDNPGTIISPVALTGENYAEWAQNMENSLRAKRKFGFVNGTISMPTDDEDKLESWNTVNSMIVGWIRTSISPKVRSTIPFTSDPRKMWDSLKKRFSVRNSVRIHQLKTELAKCRQNGSTVENYFGRLSTMWEELVGHKPLAPCTCVARDGLVKDFEEERVHQFLMGLDEARFGNVVTNLIGQEPLPDLNEAYERVIREERRLESSKTAGQQENVVGFAAKTELTSMDSFVTAVTKDKVGGACSHCGRIGHDKRDCWQIIGFPDWWVEKNPGRGRGRGNGGGGGRGKGARAHAAAASSGSTSSTVPNFTAEQWESLTKMLDRPKPISERLTGKPTGDVILDTGASHHMTGDIKILIKLRDVESCPILFADGSKIFATKCGSLVLSENVILNNVLYVGNLNCTLLSVSKLLKQTGCIAVFTDTLCVLQDRFTRTLIGAGEERDGVYFYRNVTIARGNRVTTGEDETLWHRRLGHPSFGVLSLLPFFSGVFNKNNKFGGCEICFKSKQTREVFYDSSNKALDFFDLIHCDLWGPYRTPSSCGASYFLTIVDDYTRAVWIFLLLEKSEVRTALPNFCSMAHRQFGKQVKMIRSDNGSEFMCLSDYFKTNGIIHQTSCVATPQQNGRVERKHRHILNIARALLFQANLSVDFWGEGVLAAAHLINRTPSTVLNNKMPYELLYKRPPDYTLIKTFGCLCYVHRASRDKDKFGERSRKCIFVGYPYGKKAWRLYDMATNEFFDSRDVSFDETKFPYSSEHVADRDKEMSNNQSLENFIEEEPVAPRVEVDMVNEADIVQDHVEVNNDQVEINNDHVEINDSGGAENGIDEESGGVSNEAENIEESKSIEEVGEPSLGKGKREKIPSVKLRDYVAYNAVKHSDKNKTPHGLHQHQSSDSETAPGNSAYPLEHYISDEGFSMVHRAFLAVVTTGVEPKSYKEAMKDKKWRDAVGKEVVSLEDSHTWDVTDLPPGKKALANKWVFKLKYLADGTLERHKARLVVCGNHQIEGEDYDETFAPVAKLTTVRTLFKVAAAKGWEVHQMDVHNAFLHGDLEEEVYMKLPQGFKCDDPKKVCKLRKSLYGLKQAPRCWFAKLSQALLRFGFVQSYADYTLFTYINGDISLRVLVYVDDLIISCNDIGVMNRFKEYLSECFKMKDLGKAKYFLGIEVARGPLGIFLSQRKYALDIVSEMGLLGCQPLSIPMEQNHNLLSDDGPLYKDPVQFKSECW